MEAERKICDRLGERLVALDALVRTNVSALAELAEAWDGKAELGVVTANGIGGEAGEGPQADPLYLALFQDCIMPESKMQPCVVGLNDLYERIRALQDGRHAAAGVPVWQPPSRFTRDTTKFWLKPQDVMRFKCELIKHVPLLIFDRTKQLEPGALGSESNLRDWTTVSSVYYDNHEMQHYMARLRRDDRASAVRVRFYGQRSRAPEEELFMERKVHREPWTGERSWKERSGLRQEHLLPLVCGESIPPSVAKEASARDFLQDVQQEILDDKLEPVLRTVCDRVAFQEASNDLLRISLDTHLHMFSEMDAPRSPGDWCRNDGAPLAAEEVVYFPYCVVEVKLRLEEPPEWLRRLITTGLLLQTPRFSKFLHGAAGLFPDLVPKMPYWFLHNRDGSMSPATWEEMGDNRDDFYDKNASPWLFPQQNDVPTSSKLNGILKGGMKSASTSLEAKAGQQVADLRHTRDVQAREEMMPILGTPDATSSGLETADKEEVAAASKSEGQSPAAAGDQIPPQASLAGISGVQSQVPAESQRHEQQQTNPSQLFIAPNSSPSLEPARYPVDVEAPPTARDSTERGEGCRASEAPIPGWWAAPLAAVQRPFRSRESPPPADAPPPTDAPAPPAKLVQSGYRSKALVRTRVEPKTFFANERTFLSWLQISVLIMLTGLSLLGGSFSSFSSSSGSSNCSAPPSAAPAFQSGNPAPPGGTPTGTASSPTFSTFNCRASQYAGLVISPVAVLFMIYALFMYKMRTVQIMQQRKNVRYDDQRGPVFLVVLLVGALLTAMVFTAKAAFDN